MDNEYYGVASTPMDDYLAHYGVRGMKWGVRKAIRSGNAQRLGKQYAKAQKKLAKLEKQAANSKKYAKRAAAMGAGAAAAGGLAAIGTAGVARGIARIGKGAKHVPSAMVRAGEAASKIGLTKSGSKLVRYGNAMQVAENRGKGLASKFADASGRVYNWGNSNSIGNAAANVIGQNAIKGSFAATRKLGAGNIASKAGFNVANSADKLRGVTNNTIARIGAGAVGAGLTAGAARNAYKAKTAQKKAAQFRSEMNKAFAGTKYANGGSSNTSTSKKRRRK